MTLSRKKISLTFVALIAVVGGLYLYFLGGTVVAIAERKDTQEDIRDMTSRLAEMELEYYSLSASISSEVATSQGLSQPAERHFASRAAAPAVALGN